MASPEWYELYTNIRKEKEGTFNLELLSPEILERQWAAGRTIIRPAYFATEFASGQVIKQWAGPITAHATRRAANHPGWEEVAQIWTAPEQRGNGLMKEVVCELIARTPPRTYLFSITSAEVVMKLLTDLHFLPITKENFPQNELWAEGMMLDRRRLPKTALRVEPHDPRDGERWLFIKR